MNMKQVLHIGSIRRRLPGNPRCPNCGGAADGGTYLNDRGSAERQEPGDLCVCAYCCSLNRYTEEMQLSPVPPQEEMILRQDPRIRRLLDAAEVGVRLMRKEPRA
jgi:hypothetical protein